MLLVLRHCWGPCTSHPKHPQVLLRTWKSLGLSLQPWFSFFWCCHCHISAHPTEHHPVTSLTHPVAFFHMKEWGEHLEMTFFCGWCGHSKLQTPMSLHCLTHLCNFWATPQINQLGKQWTLFFWRTWCWGRMWAIWNVFGFARTRNKLRRSKNKQFNGDGAVAPARRGCGRTSIFSPCTRWFLTTEGHKNLTAECWKIILLKVGNVLLAVNS